jgi:hypothetical protein
MKFLQTQDCSSVFIGLKLTRTVEAVCIIALTAMPKVICQSDGDFPIVKRRDEAQRGEYRTKRVILEMYDAMQRAIDTGELYQSRLDPPPGPPANGLP